MATGNAMPNKIKGVRIPNVSVAYLNTPSSSCLVSIVSPPLYYFELFQQADKGKDKDNDEPHRYNKHHVQGHDDA